MRPLKSVSRGLFALAVRVAVGAWFGLPYLNMYQTDGESSLAGLSSEVTVTRDENGMAYIRAQNLADAIEAQGFVTAQDRLFQMQLTRLLAQGRISELAGESAKPLDIMYRTIATPSGTLRFSNPKRGLSSRDMWMESTPSSRTIRATYTLSSSLRESTLKPGPSQIPFRCSTT